MKKIIYDFWMKKLGSILLWDIWYVFSSTTYFFIVNKCFLSWLIIVNTWRRLEHTELVGLCCFCLSKCTNPYHNSVENRSNNVRNRATTMDGGRPAFLCYSSDLDSFPRVSREHTRPPPCNMSQKPPKAADFKIPDINKVCSTYL